MLWEAVYGVFREALHLDSLEDFNAMEVDLMELKDNILSIWKAKDKHKTSSLGPTFVPSSVRASEKKSTLGDTFFPSSAMATAPICQSFLQIELSSRWGPVTPHKACGSATRDPLSLSVCTLQAGCSSTPGYTPWGSVMGYNFDPMMGQPLRPTVPYSYPFMSQSSDMLFSTSFCLSLADLPSLVDEDDEEPPALIVGPPSHSSCIVISGAVPTVTFSLAGAETLLSASPRVNLRMNTSITSSANQDIHRVVWQRTIHFSKHSLGLRWGWTRPGASWETPEAQRHW